MIFFLFPPGGTCMNKVLAGPKCYASMVTTVYLLYEVTGIKTFASQTPLLHSFFCVPLNYWLQATGWKMLA